MAGIKDVLGNILNPKPKVNVSGGAASKSTKTTTSGTAGKTTGSVGTGSTWVAQAEAQQKALLAKKTHQDFINAAYKTAEELKQSSPWPLIKRAGWNKFTDSRGALYTGPTIDSIEKLSLDEKKALKKHLGV